MVKIYYHGTLTNPLVKLRGSRSTRKIQNGVPFEVTEIDWAYLSTSGEFSKVEEVTRTDEIKEEVADVVPEQEPDTEKPKKKKRIKKEVE